ncbi:hypothetical protein DCCM_2547 [Desulfocucumis palustris]|uniref:Uncharacterized protein n=1 Tax=Desulfocucumis palustris TaxID=1898651 RepID=A0A2L2XGU9_9FIRM|nr:class I SAM-dependent methyltransferase [Desulfocucumis palustris]GBF33446.1 hypothetical protein DCCM_2547 [Desulfocucumis palustris]
MNFMINIENNYLTLRDAAGHFVIPLFSVNPSELNRDLSPQQLIDSFIININKYGEVIKYTYGTTTILDIIALSSLVYRTCTGVKHKNLRVLEMGSGFGCSTVFIALALKAFSEDNILFCLDTWNKAANKDGPGEIDNYLNSLEHFRAVTGYMDVSEQVKPVVCESVYGAEALRDDYFDMIFINTAGNYKNIYADILKAVRLIRPGGLIAGQGCNCKMSQLPEDIRDSIALSDDPGFIKDYNVGTIKALSAAFGENYGHFAPALVWHKSISMEDKGGAPLGETFEKMITGMFNSVMEALASINQDSLNRENIKLLYFILEMVENISGYLSNNFYNLRDREVKSTTMLLKNYIVHMINAMQNSQARVAKKYFQKAAVLHPEWSGRIRQEFNGHSLQR